MLDLVIHPFALGLYLGIAFCVYIFLSEIARRRHLKVKIRELEASNENLKSSLHTHMSISEKGNRSREEEVEDLKKQNENLRITIATLQNKPGAAELKMLYTFDRAIAMMNQRTPGFSAVWEGVLLEAQREVEESTSGIRGLLRKVFKPSVLLSSAPVPGEKEIRMVDENRDKME